MYSSGFKGYLFDEHEQPEFVVEWKVVGTGTQYTLFRRGMIGPAYKFYISRIGRRTDYDLAPRSWITHLYPQYPKIGVY